MASETFTLANRDLSMKVSKAVISTEFQRIGHGSESARMTELERLSQCLKRSD